MTKMMTNAEWAECLAYAEKLGIVPAGPDAGLWGWLVAMGWVA